MRKYILVLGLPAVLLACTPGNNPGPGNSNNNNPVDTSVITLTLDGQTYVWKAFKDANSTPDETALITDCDYTGLYVEGWHAMAGNSFGMNFRKGHGEQPAGTYSDVQNGNSWQNDVAISFIPTNGISYTTMDSMGASITIDHFDQITSSIQTAGYAQGTFTAQVIKSVNGMPQYGTYYPLTCTFKVHYKDRR
jgi:hypothetical protein